MFLSIVRGMWCVLWRKIILQYDLRHNIWRYENYNRTLSDTVGLSAILRYTPRHSFNLFAVEPYQNGVPSVLPIKFLFSLCLITRFQSGLQSSEIHIPTFIAESPSVSWCTAACEGTASRKDTNTAVRLKTFSRVQTGWTGVTRCHIGTDVRSWRS